jgi:hypothetical protein
MCPFGDFWVMSWVSWNVLEATAEESRGQGRIFINHFNHPSITLPLSDNLHLAPPLSLDLIEERLRSAVTVLLIDSLLIH